VKAFFGRANLLGFIGSFLASLGLGSLFLTGLYENRHVDMILFIFSLGLPLIYAMVSATLFWLFRGGFLFYLPLKPSRGRGGASLLATTTAATSLFLEFVRVENAGVTEREMYSPGVSAFGFLTGCFFLWFVSYAFFHWVYRKMASRRIVG
jgi:hypothetical protein